MFGSKKKEQHQDNEWGEQLIDLPDTEPMALEEAAEPAPEPALQRSAAQATIGRTVHVRGELRGAEDLLIEGRVEGSVVLEDHQLEIGGHGQIQGEVQANVVLVYGRVQGDIHAQERILVEPEGTVEGNLYAPKVVLADGARFKGSIDMMGGGKPSPSPTPKATTPPAPAPEAKQPEPQPVSQPETPPETQPTEAEAARPAAGGVQGCQSEAAETTTEPNQTRTRKRGKKSRNRNQNKSQQSETKAAAAPADPPKAEETAAEPAKSGNLSGMFDNFDPTA